MNPPARLFFNVLQMNSTEKRFRYSSMNRIISDVLDLVPTRRKLRRPSEVHWSRVAGDFHGVASRFRRPNLQAQVLECFPNAGPAGSTDELCAMKPPTLELLPGTRPASTYFPPRCGPLQDGPHGPSHPGQISLAYSRFSHLLKRNKPGTLQYLVVSLSSYLLVLWLPYPGGISGHKRCFPRVPDGLCVHKQLDTLSQSARPARSSVVSAQLTH